MAEKEIELKAKKFMKQYNLEQDKRVQKIKELILKWGVGYGEMYELVKKAYILRIKEVENEQDK